MVVLPLIGLAFSLRKVARRHLPRVPLLVIAVYACAVLVSSSVVASKRGIVDLMNPVVIALVFGLIGVVLTRRELEIVWMGLIVLGLGATALAVLEVQLKVPWAIRLALTEESRGVVRSNLVLDGFLRAAGPVGHPILLGMVCALAAIVVFSRIRWSWRLRLPLLALLGWGVLLSGSRSTIAALALGVIVLLLHRRHEINRSGRLLLLLGCFSGTWWYITSALQEARELSPFSLSNRLSAVDRIWEALSRPWLSFWFGEGDEFSLSTVADNQLLTTTGRYGLMTLLALVVAIVYALRSPRPLVAALAAAVSLLFLSFDVLAFALPTALFWMLVGASHASDGEAAEELDGAPPGEVLAGVGVADHGLDAGGRSSRLSQSRA